jgi:hypothetical protein
MKNMEFLRVRGWLALGTVISVAGVLSACSGDGYSAAGYDPVGYQMLGQDPGESFGNPTRDSAANDFLTPDLVGNNNENTCNLQVDACQGCDSMCETCRCAGLTTNECAGC